MRTTGKLLQALSHCWRAALTGKQVQLVVGSAQYKSHPEIKKLSALPNVSVKVLWGEE